MTTTTLIHFAINAHDTIKCACGDWRHATNWTTVRTAVTCPECNKRIGERPPELDRVEQGFWFGNQ